MATRSRIGIENEDGTVSSIYCHWDGYVVGVGSKLVDYYRDRDSVRELIALGSISSLREKAAPPGVSEVVELDDEVVRGILERLFPQPSHSFENPLPYVTVAYHRDRGEDLHIRKNNSVEEYFDSDLEEYGYLFNLKGEWVVKMVYHDDNSVQPVNEVLAKQT